jgi:hypothetical protein
MGQKKDGNGEMMSCPSKAFGKVSLPNKSVEDGVSTASLLWV